MSLKHEAGFFGLSTPKIGRRGAYRRPPGHPVGVGGGGTVTKLCRRHIYSSRGRGRGRGVGGCGIVVGEVDVAYAVYSSS